MSGATAPGSIFERVQVRRIASLTEDLAVWPPGTYNCGPDRTWEMMLTFRGADETPPLTVVAPDHRGCGSVSFTVGGRSLVALAPGASWEQQVLASAGVRWPRPRFG